MVKPLVVLLGVVIGAAGLTLWLYPAEAPADFTLVSGTEPTTLDPALATKLWEGRLILALFEGLVAYDPGDLSPVPGVAHRWTVSPDGLVYTFHLRPAAWSNGDPLTAEDFRFSWLRLLDPATAAPYAGLLFCVAGAEAFHRGRAGPDQVGLTVPEAATLVVRLREPTPYFLDLAAFWPLAPVHRRTVAAHGRRWCQPEHLVCNGPFVLGQWRFYQKLRLVRNPCYWDATRVRCRTIDALIVDTPASAFLVYESGLADLITTVPRFILDVLKDRPDFRTSPAWATYFFRFNCTRWPLTDARVRRALALAVDKRRLVETILRGGEEPADTLVPPGMRGYRPIRGLSFDPVAARRLLAEAGFPGGRGLPPMELLFNDVEQHKAIAEVVQACWQEHLGVHVELVNRQSLSQDVRRLDYWIVRANWFADYNDPTTFLDLFRSDSDGNRTGWAHAEYDRLLAAAHAAADPELRLARLQQAERLLVTQEMPILPVYFFRNTNLVRPQVRGVGDNGRNLHPLKYVYKEPS